MKNPDAYLEAKEELLLGLEASILQEIEPVLERTIVKVEAMPEGASDSDWEEVLGPLNDRLEQVLGVQLFLSQREIGELVMAAHPGKPPRMASAAQLLESVTIGGDSLASHFKRQSPSRWMRNLANGTADLIRSQVATMITTAVWGAATRTEQLVWTGNRWRWFTRRDESVCPVCGPRDGKVYPSLEASGWPLHFADRCSVLPES